MHHLPYDVERLLLEYAAELYPHFAPVLARLSKMTQVWCVHQSSRPASFLQFNLCPLVKGRKGYVPGHLFEKYGYHDQVHAHHKTSATDFLLGQRQSPQHPVSHLFGRINPALRFLCKHNLALVLDSA